MITIAYEMLAIVDLLVAIYKKVFLYQTDDAVFMLILSLLMMVFAINSKIKDNV